MKSIHYLLAVMLLSLASAKPATDREKRQSSDQFCSRAYDLSTTNDFNKNLIQECSTSASYPNGANWQWTFNLPGLASQYLNIQYSIRTEGQSVCSYDRLTFGSQVTVCGSQQGSFSVDVSGWTSYAIRFSSDGSVTGDLLQVTIFLRDSAYYSTSNLPSYLSNGQTGGATGSTLPYNTWTSPSYSDWNSPSYNPYDSSTYFPTSSSYNPYDSSTYFPTYFPTSSSYNPYDSSTFYPTWSSDYFAPSSYPQYTSSNSWDQSSSTYYPWQSSPNSWDQYSSPYNPWYSSSSSWDQSSSTYYPGYSATNSWDQSSSAYNPWGYSSSSWNQNTSPYYYTDSWTTSTYPWTPYTTAYPQWQNIELIRGQLLVSLDDLVRVAQGLVSLLRQGQPYAQPDVLYAAGKKK